MKVINIVHACTIFGHPVDSTWHYLTLIAFSYIMILCQVKAI